MHKHIFAKKYSSFYFLLYVTVSVVDKVQEENAVPGGGRATDLSIFTSSGPKLEDYLGGSTTAPSPPPPLPPQQQLGQFSAETQVTTLSDTSEIYDSELKTIAASFLRGFANTEQTDAQKQHQQQLQLAQVEPAPKKSVDTFGQRTSIYRGVTR